MKDSFFQRFSFRVLERHIVSDSFHFTPKPEIFPILDFFSWRLNSSHQSKDSLTTAHTKLQNFKKISPFGACVTRVSDIKFVSDFAQLLYIPGEFCRQSDILEAAKHSKLPFIVEKGNFLSPNDIQRVAEKIEGCDFCLVECGSSNGYSDSTLDPRSLFLMKQKSSYFGISLSDLIAPEGTIYSHRPKWLSNPDFIQAFITAGKSFQAHFYITKSYGNGSLDAQKILEMVKS